MSLIDTVQIDALNRFLDGTAQRQNVVALNIANIDTPGYSRQRPDLLEADAVMTGAGMAGMGVNLSQITSLRDRVLELRIDSERQQQGSLQAQVSSLRDIEVLFSSDIQNLGDSINRFFNSLSELSSNASSTALRQSVLMNAGNLVNQFRNTATALSQRQFNLDLDIQQSVTRVNQITAQIADLNGQIGSEGADSEAQLGVLVDRRSALLEELSGLIGNQVTIANDGLTVTTGNGTALVVGSRSYDLAVSKLADGSQQITSRGQDITRDIDGGKVHGLLHVRETVIPGLLSDLDSLANDFVTAFNAVHRNGIDLNGTTGMDFFLPPPAAGAGAASAMALNISNAAQIAASSDGSVGDNANLNALIAVREQAVGNGDRILDRYAKIAFNLGSEIANARTELNASELIARQLVDQRGAISGVSLDEEAANLIRYQRAYEAAARVLTVISELTEISVNLGR